MVWIGSRAQLSRESYHDLLIVNTSDLVDRRCRTRWIIKCCRERVRVAVSLVIAPLVGVGGGHANCLSRTQSLGAVRVGSDKLVATEAPRLREASTYLLIEEEIRALCRDETYTGTNVAFFLRPTESIMSVRLLPRLLYYVTVSVLAFLPVHLDV